MLAMRPSGPAKAVASARACSYPREWKKATVRESCWSSVTMSYLFCQCGEEVFWQMYVRTLYWRGMQDARMDKLAAFREERGRLPSLGELAGLLGFRSKNAAVQVARKWAAAGVVRKDEAGKLVPGPAFPGSRGLSMLGTVAAGFPAAVEEDTGDTVSLDEWLIGNRQATFMLKVSGESMLDAGIRPGDMVLLERGRAPKNGDIVVAEVDREWTIKYYERRGAAIRLVPANVKFRAIEAEEEMRLAGVVTAVIRKY
jgi:repressor LexA